MEDMLILVDDKDNPIRSEGKLSVHQQGLLHRAFSIFIFDSKGRLLLQQRALGKYHSAGLWTNSCCGHPRWGEATDAAAQRRLQEEMGFCTPLKKVSSFTYHAEVPGNLTEHEFDHIYVGLFEGEPDVNPDEVENSRWIDVIQLLHEIELHPEKFTTWFRLIINSYDTNEITRWEKLASR
ncbi:MULTISPECIES: isopentenyl-diphosphate Delta-isomerase [unclassified Serratia (in: enterobacteria)]|uniref:isopentenyl-diphosphate Delta-isomerase n=1 Tax=unclassified Serratia (in: enterobacteria) TaxID=2647522 RepID=UPI002ED1B2D5|nr:isopentenyl-diphosphate Delta-isomerase [Serratia sp. C2(2)]MEE4446740.1 isopentenyl-diphosphate Delta-isomerase [Serratia sp. C2(1)]